MENELEQEIEQAITLPFVDYKGKEKANYVYSPDVAMAVKALITQAHNKAIEAALEALPELGESLPRTDPRYRDHMIKRDGFSSCLDQARSNIERLKK